MDDELIKNKIKELMKEDKEFREEVSSIVQTHEEDYNLEDQESSESSKNRKYSPKERESNGMDRRGFMKSIMGGAAGLGAAAMVPSAAGIDFFSQDTVDFYEGEGSSEPDGTLRAGRVDASNIGSGGGSGGVNVAQPGNVQAAIDAAAGNGGGMVSLDPKQTYDQPSSPWIVKNDVILNFNGAILRGTGSNNNADIIHLQPGAQLHNPRIDLYNDGNGYNMSNSYQGRVFSLDTGKYGSYFAHGTGIRNGYINAAGNGGTALYLGVKENRTHLTHNNFDFDVGIPRNSTADSAMGTGAVLDTTGAGDDGWINGVHIQGHWRYVNTGVLQKGEGYNENQQNYNYFRIQSQPGDDSNAFWKIADDTFARANIWRGVIWDTFDYPGAAWKIDSTWQGDASYKNCSRNSVITANIYPNEHDELIRNRSNGTNHVVDPTTMESWDV
jgi:hypothetical protein